MKKSVKKVLTAAIVLCFIFALTACSSRNESNGGSKNSNYAGMWKVASMEMSGISVEPSQFGYNLSFVFNEDGTASLIEDGKTEEGGKWEEKDGTIIVTETTLSSDKNLTFNIEGEKLVMEKEGKKLVLEKQ